MNSRIDNTGSNLVGVANFFSWLEILLEKISAQLSVSARLCRSLGFRRKYARARRCRYGYTSVVLESFEPLFWSAIHFLIASDS